MRTSSSRRSSSYRSRNSTTTHRRTSEFNAIESPRNTLIDTDFDGDICDKSPRITEVSVRNSRSSMMTHRHSIAMFPVDLISNEYYDDVSNGYVKKTIFRREKSANDVKSSEDEEGGDSPAKVFLIY